MNIDILNKEKEYLKKCYYIIDSKIKENDKHIKEIVDSIDTSLYDYFNGVTYYLNNNSIYKTTNRAELMEIKNKYDSGEYGLFSECIFLKEHNELPYVMFKNGLMGYVDEENNYEYYFTCAKKNLN